MKVKWTLLSFFSILSFTLADDDDNDQIDYKSLFGDSPRRDLLFPDLVRYDNYPVETHNVTTEDGYILTIFRIPRNSSCEPDEDRVPHIFMHGLYLTGDDCIIPGPGRSHCYLYSDHCFDVWIPNNRGNTYSRNHISLDPDKDPEFWNFSMDEMGLYDLPAIIDYILDNTGKSQVTYIGHSQAVGTLMLLCAKKPEYNAKIKVGFGISSAVDIRHARLFVVEIETIFAELFKTSNHSNFEIVPRGGLVQSAVKLLCGISAVEYPFCSLLIFAVLGYNRFQITPDTLKVLTGHTPGGTSFKDFIRWGQIHKLGFCEYDHGETNNLELYGSAMPPAIDMSPVTMKWKLISSVNDVVGDVRDIAIWKKQLSDVEECILRDKTFGHLDFIYGRSLDTYIVQKVLNVLKGGNFTCDDNQCT